MSCRAHQTTKRILMTNIYGRTASQSSIFHRFPLKSGCMKIPPLLLSLLVIELQSSLKNLNHPNDQLIRDRISFQSSIYHIYPLFQGCILLLCHYIHNIQRGTFSQTMPMPSWLLYSLFINFLAFPSLIEIQ